MRLSELLEGIVALDPRWDRGIQGLTSDSRALHPGEVFCALAGTRTHGQVFAGQAVSNGAVAVLLETARGAALEQELAERYAVPVIAVPALSRHLGELAERFHGYPSRAMTVVGVTGTNGKTSCSHFIAQALTEDGPCGVIGTVGNGLYGSLEAASHTTPDALALHALLARFLAQGARGVSMEVSSHGLEQGRVNGVAFDVAVFTNLSRDHLDYHADMASYGRAKQRLFDMPGLRHAVINADDGYGRELLAGLPATVRAMSYGLDPAFAPQVRGSDLMLDDAGLRMRVTTPWGEGELRSTLLGRFNASNLLAVLAVLCVLEVPLAEALARLARLRPVPGRMERHGDRLRQPQVVVDYAHSPDALEQVLRALREHCRGRLWCVFGCGGERDRGKRPLMGAIAARLADAVIITDDNPRRESGGEIVQEILAGIAGRDKVRVERDRAQAITRAVREAHAGDVVLVAGKGHEDYQLVGEQRLPFSDSALVRELLGLETHDNKH